MKVRSDRGRRRATLLAAALTLVATTGYATAPPEDVVSFQIETITVEAERLSPEIVLSESLLREGREYSESELREAVHRINRLPFVLLAEFSLRRGSERGRYELVIRVYEARRWFSQLALGLAVDDPVDRFRAGGFGDSLLGSDDDFDALIGRRFAVGRRGILFASFGTEAGLFAVGYQRYNLWDRNVLFSVTLGGEEEDNSRSRRVRAQLGIPIRGNHALRLLAGWNRFEYSSRFFGGSESRDTELELAWVFNSLDDPVLPREGLLLELGLVWSERDDRDVFRFVDGSVVREDFSQERLGLVGSASRHWPVGARQSFSAGVGGRLDDDPGREWQAAAHVGHQIYLVRNQEPGRWRELRWETELAGARDELASDLVPPGFPDGVNTWRLRTGVTYRNGWGLFRFFVEHGESSFG